MLMSFTFLTSMISTPADAAVVTFPCGTSGSYTVTDGVLTGNSGCVGSLNVDGSVVEIANEAFANIRSLTSINIPGTVVTIGELAFSRAGATSITLGEGLIEIKPNAFNQLNDYGGPLLDISIPNSVTTLGDGAFQQNRFGKITIGNSITNIARQAFYSNFGGGATSVDFGSSVTTIGLGTFFGFRGSTLNFPEGLETIGPEAFSGAYSLTTVFLPTSLTSIASNAFNYPPSTILYCGSNPDIANYAFPAPNNAKVCGNLVRFDRNGANNNQPAQQVSSGSANLTILNWTKPGNTFLRWTTNQDGTGSQYSSGGVFPFTAGFSTLYAQWQATPKVIFDANTGFGGMDDQLSSVAANLDAAQFEKCGFDFAGWSTNPNGGPTTYQDQASFPFVAAETRLYAQWTSLGLTGNRVRSDVAWNPVNGSSGSNAFNNGTVLTMVVNPVSGDLYAGGTFTNVEGLASADYIAKWDGASWSALGSDGSGNGALAPGLGSGSSGVYDLAFDSSGNLFVTGNFSISGVAKYFAKWNGTSWSSVGTGLEFNDSGRAIAIDSRNHIYLGGHFRDVAGVSAVDNLAKWDGSEWRGVGNSGINDIVRSIAIGLNDSVYIGTFASDIAGIPEADYIAKWNGSAWSALGGTLAGNGQLRDMPRNITVDSRSGVDVVYVGNLSSRIRDLNGNNTNVGYFVKWDGSQWGRALPDVLITDDYVTEVALAPGGGLVIGGWFYATDNQYGDGCNTYQRSLAYFDGTSTFGLGVNGTDQSFSGSIDSVVFNKDGKLVVGGSFRSAGGNSSASRIAILSNNLQQIPIPVQTTTAPPMPVVALDPRPVASAQGQAFTLNSANLGDVFVITVGGKEASVVRKANGEFVIDLPAGLEGRPDVVIVSTFGTITMQGFLKVVKPYEFTRTVTITEFVGSRPTLAGLRAIDRSYLVDKTANLLSCIATVAIDATEEEVALAESQARTSCQRVVNYSRHINSADVRVLRTGQAGSSTTIAVTFDKTISGN